jgi:branched-chain amino acid transport system substrate-binding protein
MRSAFGASVYRWWFGATVYLAGSVLFSIASTPSFYWLQRIKLAEKIIELGYLSCWLPELVAIPVSYLLAIPMLPHEISHSRRQREIQDLETHKSEIVQMINEYLGHRVQDIGKVNEVTSKRQSKKLVQRFFGFYLVGLVGIICLSIVGLTVAVDHFPPWAPIVQKVVIATPTPTPTPTGIYVMPTPTHTLTATPAQTPYKVGALFASSGFNSPLGQPEVETVSMLVKQINDAGGINGHPLDVIMYDTQSDTATAATLANKLIEQGVVAIIGPTSTGESMAVKPIVNQANVTLISCAAGSVIVEPVDNYAWVFNTPQLDYVAIERLYTYLQEQNIAKIAILTDTAGFGAAGRKWLVNTSMLTKYGLTIVPNGDQTYGSSDVDMQAQLTQIRGTDAQAIVCWGTNPGPAIVAHNMRTLGMTIPLLCSHGIAFKSFIDSAGTAANGVIFCAGKLPIVDQLPDTDPQKALLEQYKTDFGAAYGVGSANIFGGYAYDALNMVVDALKNVGPDKAKIRDYIENDIVNWPGIGGVYNMSPQDHNGLPRDPKQAMILVKIVDGRWTWLQD